MDRFGGTAGGLAAFALTAGVASDNGGFGAVSWDRTSIVLGALAILLVLLGGGGERPTRSGAVLLSALGLLAAWTAASWLWSDSPPRALEEAQRVALYVLVAAAFSLGGRRLPVRSTIAGVASAAAFVATWNLTTRIVGVAHPGDSGALARPVGYANSLALLCVVGLLLLPALPRLALLLGLPLGADLIVQGSVGALAALVAGGLAFGVVAYPRARIVIAVVVICAAAGAPFAFHGHERTQYWRVAVREVGADHVLGSGAGTFRDWWLRERTVPLSTQEAHSLYLETLAELGPVGILLLLAALAAPLAAAARLREPALVAALVAYDVAAAVDFHWELAGATVPVIVLAASAAAHTRRARAQHVRRAPVVVALGALTLAMTLAYAGNVRVQQAEDALASGDNARAVDRAHAALRYAPYSTDAWRVIGDAERSAAPYRRALALDRNDWSLWFRLASVSKGEPRRLALREAARLNPLR